MGINGISGTGTRSAPNSSNLVAMRSARCGGGHSRQKRRAAGGGWRDARWQTESAGAERCRQRGGQVCRSRAGGPLAAPLIYCCTPVRRARSHSACSRKSRRRPFAHRTIRGGPQLLARAHLGRPDQRDAAQTAQALPPAQQQSLDGIRHAAQHGNPICAGRFSVGHV